MGADTPPWAWGGIKFTGDPAMAANPPTILALLSKLQGNVDPAKILEFAPGEMKNLPGYEGDGVGSASKLGGFDAWQIGGTYNKNGVKHAVAQKTVVIPGSDGLFVLQLNADGTEDQMGALMDHTSAVTAFLPPAPNEPPPPQRGLTQQERGRDISAAQANAEAETSKVRRYLKTASPRFLWSMAEGYPIVLKQFIQFCLILIYPGWLFFVIVAAA